MIFRLLVSWFGRTPIPQARRTPYRFGTWLLQTPADSHRAIFDA